MKWDFFRLESDSAAFFFSIQAFLPAITLQGGECGLVAGKDIFYGALSDNVFDVPAGEGIFIGKDGRVVIRET